MIDLDPIQRAAIEDRTIKRFVRDRLDLLGFDENGRVNLPILESILYEFAEITAALIVTGRLEETRQYVRDHYCRLAVINEIKE